MGKITTAMLSFTAADSNHVLEKGAFTVWIGEDSDTVNEGHFVIE